MIQQRIQISNQIRAEAKRLMEDGQKIRAIKLVRSSGKSMPGTLRETPNDDGGFEKIMDHKVGLRDAKDACEHLFSPSLNPRAILTTRLQIKKVIVEGETGNVELDIEQLQLRCLDGLSQGIPLSEVAAMTELITFVREWQGE
jgi:hypothetical protein